jgi:peptide chain release factor 1
MDEVSALLAKLVSVRDRFREVEKLVGDPDVISDQTAYRELMREYRRLEPIVQHAEMMERVHLDVEQAKKWLSGNDADYKELAREELPALESKLRETYEDGRIMLLPRDSADDRSAMLEVRAGTGGDEAALFAGEVYRMYLRYAEQAGWKVEFISAQEGTVGGYKEVVARIEGDGVYGRLKFESGVHRVQRVPETESQGRVHTSASTVAILPVAEEFDVELNLSDVRRDTFRASGAGGQHVNKTESAVRLTHLPTGIVVECQDGRSQHANYDHALQVLRTRLYEAERDRRRSEQAAERKSLVSTGDRSAKIRTYNFPQGRVTDHRIGLTLHALPAILGGDLNPLLDALHLAEQTELLKHA